MLDSLSKHWMENHMQFDKYQCGIIISALYQHHLGNCKFDETCYHDAIIEKVRNELNLIVKMHG